MRVTIGAMKNTTFTHLCDVIRFGKKNIAKDFPLCVCVSVCVCVSQQSSFSKVQLTVSNFQL